MNLVSKGNSKLGPHVYHVNHTPGAGCPGATDWCAANCYATKGHYTFPNVVDKYRNNLSLLLSDPTEYERQLSEDMLALPIGAIFRWHTGGDIVNGTHVDIIRRMAELRPDVTFYLYTRSWRVPGLKGLIEMQLFGLHNLTVWASTDDTSEEAPAGWREARVFETFEHAKYEGYKVHCPEQTGRKPNCESCGLCFNARSNAKLAFARH